MIINDKFNCDFILPSLKIETIRHSEPTSESSKRPANKGQDGAHDCDNLDQLRCPIQEKYCVSTEVKTMCPKTCGTCGEDCNSSFKLFPIMIKD